MKGKNQKHSLENWTQHWIRKKMWKLLALLNLKNRYIWSDRLVLQLKFQTNRSHKLFFIRLAGNRIRSHIFPYMDIKKWRVIDFDSDETHSCVLCHALWLHCKKGKWDAISLNESLLDSKVWPFLAELNFFPNINFMFRKSMRSSYKHKFFPP